MILKELMREDLDVYTLTENGNIAAAAAMMQENRVGSIVIVDELANVVGIITDRDIALSLALGAATSNSYVSEVMSKEVETISEELNLFDVSRFFRTVDVKRLPVVNFDNQLVGIVSLDDVLAWLSREMFNACSSLESKLGHTV